MASSSNDLGEIENELFGDEEFKDSYTKEVQEKTNRKLVISNFMESKEQSRISKFGG